MLKKTIKGLFVLASVGMLLTGCSSPAVSYYSDGMKLYEMENYAEAEKMFLQATAKDNTNADYFTALGMNYIEMQEYQKAQEAFEISVNLEPEQQLAYRGFGINYFVQGKYDEAVSNFSKAISYTGTMVDTLDYDILAYRGQAEYRGKFYSEALETYNALIALKYDLENSYYTRGLVYLAQGKQEEALQDFQACAKIAGNDIDRNFDIYQTLRDAGLPEKGEAYLSAILNIKDDSVSGHLNRGKVYYILKKYENAMTELKFAQQNDSAEAVLYIGLCYEALGDYENAKEMYVNFLRTHGQVTAFTQEIYAQYAYCEVQLGQYVFAQQIIEQALAMGESEIYCDLLWNEIQIAILQENYSTAYDKALVFQEKYPEDARIEQELAFLQMKVLQ